MESRWGYWIEHRFKQKFRGRLIGVPSFNYCVRLEGFQLLRRMLLENICCSSNSGVDTGAFRVVLGLTGFNIGEVENLLVHRAFRSSLRHDTEDMMVHEVLANIFIDNEGLNALGFECFEWSNTLHHIQSVFRTLITSRQGNKTHRYHQELRRLQGTQCQDNFLLCRHMTENPCWVTHKHNPACTWLRVIVQPAEHKPLDRCIAQDLQIGSAFRMIIEAIG